MTDQIKPCPFCREDNLVSLSGNDNRHWVHYWNCSANGNAVSTEEKAIARWNAVSDAVREKEARDG